LPSGPKVAAVVVELRRRECREPRVRDPGRQPVRAPDRRAGRDLRLRPAQSGRESFDLGPDLKGNDLWVGDVGQNDIEEVDRVTSGANYGWRIREGAFGFDEAGFDSKGFESDASVFPMGKPAALTDPVANYDHGDGTAVIGGNVYRGSAMPALIGTYVFGDTSRRLNNRHGRIFGIPPSATPEAPATISELGDGRSTARSPGSARTVSASSTR
jgi:hypothetical protein